VVPIPPPIHDGRNQTGLAGRPFAIAFAETLHLEGIAASIGSVGDAYDNALAESTIGLFKTEVIGRNSPFRAYLARTIDDIEEVANRSGGTANDAVSRGPARP
jgi:putative transposase